MIIFLNSTLSIDIFIYIIGNIQINKGKLNILSTLPFQNIYNRISSESKLRRLLKLAKELHNQNPDSEFVRTVIKNIRKKFWFGAKSVTYSSISSLVWQRFISFQISDIIKIKNLYFINDHALISEYSDIFLADMYEAFCKLEGDVLSAAQILACLSDEGPYQSRNVFIKPDDVVIDAGANMGVFSLFAYPKAKKIYAFEPQKRVVDILNRNIDLNNAGDKISIIPLGLSDEDEILELKYNPQFGHVASSVITQSKGYSESEMIHCVKLDSWVYTKQIPKIDLIKADVEGSERDLLNGAINILKTHAPRLSVCTYHLPDDPVVLEKIILGANSDYIIEHTSHKLFAYVPSNMKNPN